MTHYIFKRLSWIIVIALVNLLIAAIAGYATEKWFEVLAAIYVGAAAIYLYIASQ